MELSERNIKQLESEGYKTVYEIFDDPNTSYPEHSHETEHSIIITEGLMEVEMNGEKKIFSVGDQFYIPPNKKHVVKVGSEGCKYVIGE